MYFGVPRYRCPSRQCVCSRCGYTQAVPWDCTAWCPRAQCKGQGTLYSVYPSGFTVVSYLDDVAAPF